MLVFRSEEHVDRWLSQGHDTGERMTIEQQWALAQRWFAGRHLPQWKKRTAQEAETVLASVGLTGSFWEFT